MNSHYSQGFCHFQTKMALGLEFLLEYRSSTTHSTGKAVFAVLLLASTLAPFRWPMGLWGFTGNAPDSNTLSMKSK